MLSTLVCFSTSHNVTILYVLSSSSKVIVDVGKMAKICLPVSSILSCMLSLFPSLMPCLHFSSFYADMDTTGDIETLECTSMIATSCLCADMYVMLSVVRLVIGIWWSWCSQYIFLKSSIFASDLYWYIFVKTMGKKTCIFICNIYTCIPYVFNPLHVIYACSWWLMALFLVLLVTIERYLASSLRGFHLFLGLLSQGSSICYFHLWPVKGVFFLVKDLWKLEYAIDSRNRILQKVSNMIIFILKIPW